jgi:hypothetical protein
VSATCTFAAVDSPAALCDRLNPDPPNDKCEQGEAQFMALMLNICKGRVAETVPIASSCTSNTTVGQSRAEADALLCNPNRDHATCTTAQCESEEINSGAALQLNSLQIIRQGDGTILLVWSAPYTVPGFSVPDGYRVWRRSSGDQPFVQIAETPGMSFIDVAAQGGNYQYEVTPTY